YPTSEFRVCDVCTRGDEAVCIAAIVQAIVAKIWKLRRDNLTFRVYPSDFIEENKWRAVRYGFDGRLVDFGKGVELPARELVRELLVWFIDDVLDELGSRKEVEYAFRILDEGSSADRRLQGRGRCSDRRDGGRPIVPVIGITTQTLEAIPDQLPRCWVMSQRYVQVLTAAGAIPWVIPLLEGNEGTLRQIYERLDGLFLPGGVDVDPVAYGEPRSALCGRTDPARDWTELLFVRWALADRKPVLAVCRGAQLVNVAVGGSLYQDVGAQHPDAI